jgi:hypothetical protein
MRVFERLNKAGSRQSTVDREDVHTEVCGFLAVDCELSTVNCFSERRPAFLRSDSDSNTFNTFSTPTTLCSESERKNEALKPVRSLS